MIINIQAPALNGLLIEIVEILNANQSNYVSTIDFLKQGVLSPAAGIARLKDKGVNTMIILKMNIILILLVEF